MVRVSVRNSGYGVNTDSYKDYLRLGLRTLAPLPPATSLPQMPKDVDGSSTRVRRLCCKCRCH
ncbi:hypothetical protein KC19_N013300 [Ceratodon purpureus]|nr:hypothetical protein KC19_N013300 [Ceratodon purpureus]